jgi:peptidoglycan-N-acetylglucosamine deacetylase
MEANKFQNLKVNLILANNCKNLKEVDEKDIDWSSAFPRDIIFHGPRHHRNIALTFDDGPDAYYTPQLLEVLARNNVPATFMCLGENIRGNPEVLYRILCDGHVVGNHSWNHPDMTKLSSEEIEKQIECTNVEFKRLIGVRPRLFRPPYGFLNLDIVCEAISHNHKIIMWDVDSEDWKGIPSYDIERNVLCNIGPGSIILMHSAYFMLGNSINSLEAVDFIIKELKAHKYHFVTLPSLLNMPAYYL